MRLPACSGGADVYLFLTGMMLLAELAREEGLFDWLAAAAARAARGSPTRLFALIYAAGVVVTVLLSGTVMAVGSNAVNNLPAGLVAERVAAAASAPERIRSAILIGVDLGPNLSVTGSLATILWLNALKRDGYHVSAWTFLKLRALVVPPAFLLAVAAGLAFG
jgi:arsenical pump membrane protein